MAFIGIDREIESHWIYQDAEYFKVWFEILLRARYSSDPEKTMLEGKLVTVERGQFIFGRISWSKRLGISEQRLRTLFKKLVSDGMVEPIQKFPKFSLYRVKNYEKYNQQSNHQQSQSDQGESGTGNQQSNGESTSSQPAANQHPTTQEQGSNNDDTKKTKKTYTPEFDEFWNVYPRKIEKADCFKTWQKVLKAGEQSSFIIQCAMNYSAECQKKKTEQQYIKHPKTFLNEERYKDYKFIAVGGNNNGEHRTGTQGIRLGSYPKASGGESIVKGRTGWIGNSPHKSASTDLSDLQ
ncbi:hypothetical protein [Paenibacillus harenae]|uniref:hypothetical protein n=1 Tax=Paenibacillus harenae TaxID=306543 RepID=UPI002790EA5C|nr:hypothetical protein [Paenibacillus harenae]MDQ0062354.1 hypothetical protein [Paenibacillus harenae]